MKDQKFIDWLESGTELAKKYRLLADRRMNLNYAIEELNESANPAYEEAIELLINQTDNLMKEMDKIEADFNKLEKKSRGKK